MIFLHEFSSRFARRLDPVVFAVFAVCALGPSLAAQDSGGKAPYSMVYLDFGGDVFRPQASSTSTPTRPCPNSLITNFSTACAEEFSSVGSFTMAMGVRPIRYLQIDGLSVSVLGNFNGWGDRTSTFQCVTGCSTPSITRQTIGGRSAVAATGARLVVPFFRERLLVSAGAGVAWLWTNERAQPLGNEQVTCTSCRHVGGHGPTETAEVMYLPNQHLGIGFHVRHVQVNSTGLTPVANTSNLLLGTKYKERCFLIGAEISIRFASRR